MNPCQAAPPPTTEPAPAATGVISSWDLSIGVDGPGTRFVVFTSGCPLRCLYCQNPETWHMRDGHPVTTEEVMTEIGNYRRFITVAGGGVTISGGEPLLQPRFTADLLHRCRDSGLHTALDTSGLLGERATDAMLADTDLVLLDIKSYSPATYRRVTGGPLQPTLRFARRLANLGRPTWIRFVLVPGLTDDPADIDGLARFVSGLGNVERVDVLPFHRMATGKYRRLGLPFPLADTPPPDEDLLARVHDQFHLHGVATT
ncbi:pyruvate formate-lyase-activating protein [Nonomuraea muscovyensis]|uniref:pyruvate formate-lyase-activating protein n=1 Tax=Nonomuraea muscovyensis TaxID=1124761 RepID=UPI0033DB75F2